MLQWCVRCAWIQKINSKFAHYECACLLESVMLKLSRTQLIFHRNGIVYPFNKMPENELVQTVWVFRLYKVLLRTWKKCAHYIIFIIIRKIDNSKMEVCVCVRCCACMYCNRFAWMLRAINFDSSHLNIQTVRIPSVFRLVWPYNKEQNINRSILHLLHEISWCLASPLYLLYLPNYIVLYRNLFRMRECCNTFENPQFRELAC